MFLLPDNLASDMTFKNIISLTTRKKTVSKTSSYSDIPQHIDYPREEFSSTKAIARGVARDLGIDSFHHIPNPIEWPKKRLQFFYEQFITEGIGEPTLHCTE